MMEYHGMKSVPATAKDLRKRKSHPSTYATETASNKRGGGSAGGDKPLTGEVWGGQFCCIYAFSVFKIFY
jgi:hypothetical protein